MIPQDVIMDMATIGLSPEQARVVASMLARVEEATNAGNEASKEKNRARWRKWKEGHPTNVSKRLQTPANVSKRLAGVEDVTSTSEVEEKKESKKAARGTRLPSDFHLPDEWRDWALKRGLPIARVSIEFEKLTNWAASAPGSKAVKADWFKAWQNWVISAIDALPQNRAPPPVKSNPGLNTIDALMEDCDNAVTSSETQGNPPYLSLVALSGNR